MDKEKENKSMSKDDLTKTIVDAVTTLGNQIREDIKNDAEEVTKKEVEEKIEEAKSVIQTPLTEDDELEVAEEEASKKEWPSFGEYLKKVWLYRGGFNRMPDNRLIYVNEKGLISNPKEMKKVDNEEALIKTMTEGTDSAGGFIVPEEYRMEVQQLKLENQVIRPNGPTVFPMTTDTLNIPRIDDTSHTSTVFGGVVATWTEEAGTKTETEPTWGNCKLSAHELAGYTRASNALIADSAVALEVFIKRAFGEAWAYFEDDSFINGNGVGQPLGILNSGCLTSVTRQDTNEVFWGDIVRLWTRLLPQCRDKAVWIMNHEVEKEILRAVAENTTAAATAGNVIVVSQDQGAVKTPPRVLFGRPYFISEKMGALGDAGDIGVFDLSYYFIGDRSPLAIDTSGHVGFTSNTTYWRFTVRVDGQPWLANDLTPRHGTDTIGPFVALSSTS